MPACPRNSHLIHAPAIAQETDSSQWDWPNLDKRNRNINGVPPLSECALTIVECQIMNYLGRCLTEPTNIPITNTEPYDGSALGLKLGHSYKLLLHVDKIEDLSYGPFNDRPHTQSFNWKFGVPDGENTRPLARVTPGCTPKHLIRRRDFEDDDTDGEKDHPRQLRAKSIWSRIGCRDDSDVANQPSQGKANPSDTYNHKSYSAPLLPKPCTQQGQLAKSARVASPLLIPSDDFAAFSSEASQITPSSSVDPMREEAVLFSNSLLLLPWQETNPSTQVAAVDVQENFNEVDSFHTKMNDFIRLIEKALPQPIITTPPKVQKTTPETTLSAVQTTTQPFCNQSHQGFGHEWRRQQPAQESEERGSFFLPASWGSLILPLVASGVSWAIA
ncbi:hypothetical protein ABZP36_024129 [Zizania latifolia]